MIAIEYNVGDLEADLVVENRHLKTDEGLEAAVCISLFTDKRVDRGLEHPGPLDDLRGWWGDKFLGYSLGSKLWLLGRDKPSDAYFAKLKAYAEDALRWLVDEKVAAKVEVTVERFNASTVAFTVAVYRPEDRDSPWLKTWEARRAF